MRATAHVGLLFLCSTGLIGSQPQAPTGTGLILGRVFDADAGTPVSGVVVSAIDTPDPTAIQQTARPQAMLTDAQGRFVFRNAMRITLGEGETKVQDVKISGSYTPLLPSPPMFLRVLGQPPHGVRGPAKHRERHPLAFRERRNHAPHPECRIVSRDERNTRAGQLRFKHVWERLRFGSGWQVVRIDAVNQDRRAWLKGRRTLDGRHELAAGG
jgi:hypothetical protein